MEWQEAQLLTALSGPSALYRVLAERQRASPVFLRRCLSYHRGPRRALAARRRASTAAAATNSSSRAGGAAAAAHPAQPAAPQRPARRGRSVRPTAHTPATTAHAYTASPSSSCSTPCAASEVAEAPPSGLGCCAATLADSAAGLKSGDVLLVTPRLDGLGTGPEECASRCARVGVWVGEAGSIVGSPSWSPLDGLQDLPIHLGGVDGAGQGKGKREAAFELPVGGSSRGAAAVAFRVEVQSVFHQRQSKRRRVGSRQSILSEKRVARWTTGPLPFERADGGALGSGEYRLTLFPEGRDAGLRPTLQLVATRRPGKPSHVAMLSADTGALEDCESGFEDGSDIGSSSEPRIDSGVPSQSTTPGSAVRERLCPPPLPDPPPVYPVVYEFERNRVRWRTGVDPTSTCALCRLQCTNLFSLLKHLELCHDRFFVTSSVKNGAAIIRLRLCQAEHAVEGASCVADVAQQEMFFARASSEDPNPASGFAARCTAEFHDDGRWLRIKELIREQSDRVLYHTKTSMVRKDADADSEDEVDEGWLRQSSDLLLEEFNDVNPSEKQMFRLWNTWSMQHGFLKDSQLPEACRLFATAHRAELRPLRNNFALHLSGLFDYGLLTQADVLAALRAAAAP